MTGSKTGASRAGRGRARAASAEPALARQTTAAKLVQLLEALAAHDKGIGVRELERETGIDKSAISRLFDQLRDLEVATQTEASGRFGVGPRLFALAATIHGRDTLWLAAEPILRRLVAQFNETCYLATRELDQIMFREKIDCDHTLRYVIDAGERVALHAGAGGRAVLAGLPPEEVDEVLERIELSSLTPRTVTDRDKLRRQSAKDRRRGYSMSTGERVVGGCAIAAPYFRADGVCRGSIVLTCPASRFDTRSAPTIAEAVVAASRQLSARLGHRLAGATRTDSADAP